MAKFYYAAQDATTYFGLWVKSDGTSAGTKEVKSGASDLYPSDFIALGDEVLFVGDDALSSDAGVWEATPTAASELVDGDQSGHVLSPSNLTRVRRLRRFQRR